MLDGIYTGLARGLVLRPGSTSFMNSLGDVDIGVSKVAVTFYPDGKVYRRVPEGGLEGWDRTAAEADVPDLWGTYIAVGPGRWEIHWNNSTRVSAVVREANGLRYEDAPVFPVATCEGLLLDGTYLHPGALDSSYRPNTITFSAAGEFIDNSLIGDVAYENFSMPNRRTIGPGQGKYHSGRNTLYLENEDGRRVPVEIHAHVDDLKAGPVPRIFINGWVLVRRK